MDGRCKTLDVINSLGGTWRLITWRRIATDGTIGYPLGRDARGQLSYAPNGQMGVQITAENRPEMGTADPLGGDVQARADAYSSYLAYFGTYEVTDDAVVHNIEGSLFPGWSGEKQVRPFAVTGGELVLRTPPMQSGDGTTVVNELSWARDEPGWEPQHS
jgi:hypothetical protein